MNEGTVPHGSPAGGDIDRLLTEFFRRELPDPWPAVPASAQVPVLALTPASLSGRRAGTPGRWTLAVSLAAAAVLAITLAGRIPAPTGGSPASPDSGTATMPKHLRGR
jgi:hypothetical protein